MSKTKTKTTRTIVTDEQIVKAVIPAIKAGKNKAEVAAELGLKPDSLSVRLSNLRSKGVPIPRFPRGVKKTQEHFDQIAELARSLMEETE